MSKFSALSLLFCSALGGVPLVAQPCVLNDIIVSVNSRNTEVSVELSGTCSGGAAEPELLHLRKEGLRTELHLSQLTPPASSRALFDIPWTSRFGLGRLPAGTNTLAVMAPSDSGAVELDTRPVEVAAPSCGSTRIPGATLLFPYMEAELDDPQGLSTLVAVTNVSSTPVLARATLWSDWGLPVLAFDLYFRGRDVITMNFRDLLAGRLPQTGEDLNPESFLGCSAPLTQPQLDAAGLAQLQNRLRGLPEPGGTECYGSPRGEGASAVAFMTVDVLNRCSTDAIYPTDTGYFAADGDGVAADVNTLWGDFFYLDRGENAASGFEAVSIVADGTTEPPEFSELSFYGRSNSNRRLSSTTHETRFLNGGAFDGGGELIVWMQRFLGQASLSCTMGGLDGLDVPGIQVEMLDEDGTLPIVNGSLPAPAYTRRIPISELEPAPANAAGLLRLTTVRTRIVAPPVEFDYPSVVLTRLTASGRFSVGYAATPIDDRCP